MQVRTSVSWSWPEMHNNAFQRTQRWAAFSPRVRHSRSLVHRRRLLNTDAKRILVRDVLKEAIKQYGIRLYA
jgi:hypothetical protein